MMTALATVTSVKSKEHEFDVVLSCEQKTSCSSCQSKSSCGTGIVSKAVGNKQLLWSLKTDKSVKQGDVVEIGFPENHLLKSAALAYLLPLLFLFIGAVLSKLVLGPWTEYNELTMILSAIIFSVFGFFIARKWIAKLEQSSSQQVVLIRVLGQSVA
ncbi:SoxR reducing system RseC family protein [Vibrio hippocampi]|uniref:Protein RseC n=1 Tax=Vibrio hippocampi TaxID=654686 RepID=A0ABM8ZK49_9VIBR|nr:SoxR reducing system RseC family protein [Vibrio hippocampi]CAH0527151.1 Protein RseC [Vibrio hippocampi]